MTVIAAILAGLLGLLHGVQGVVFARTTAATPQGEGQEPARGSLSDPRLLTVPSWARLLFGFGGVVVAASAVLIYLESLNGLWVYAGGWLLIQTMAIYNGLKAYGNLRWSHHLTRFVVFGAVFGVAYVALT